MPFRAFATIASNGRVPFRRTSSFVPAGLQVRAGGPETGGKRRMSKIIAPVKLCDTQSARREPAHRVREKVVVVFDLSG